MWVGITHVGLHFAINLILFRMYLAKIAVTLAQDDSVKAHEILVNPCFVSTSRIPVN